MLDDVTVPIVQAPLAGGPSTPALAAAVSAAGGLGFLAAGYRTAEQVAADIAAIRAQTDRPFGVNVFVPGAGPADAEAVARYAAELEPLFRAAGVEPGTPRFDDDGFEEKVALLLGDPPAVVSFTFGCPSADVIASLRAAGSEVWVTVTDVDEARRAERAGASGLVVQGNEAGGHRGSWSDREETGDDSVLALLQLAGAHTAVPLIAAGGIATGRAVAAVLAGGAWAAQVGTAFLLCPEAGTSAPHREALASPRGTALTRAFTGRLARGIVNRMMREHGPAAPIAYPEVHHLTAPLRAHGRQTGDAEIINLWAGQTHQLAEALPAAEVVAKLHREAIEALRAAEGRLAPAGPGGGRQE